MLRLALQCTLLTLLGFLALLWWDGPSRHGGGASDEQMLRIRLAAQHR